MSDNEALWDEEVFAARVREAIERSGRSEAEVFSAAGVSRSILARPPLDGSRTVTSIVRLARALDVDPGELAFGARKA